jgi:peroxiredoxin
VKVGGQLIDFTAPDLEGKPHRFSDLAKDKVVLLDLWATTCGSCIRKSRTVVPVYEDFKNQGFTVIGVARAFNNTDRVSEILEKEQFPWLTLTELDDEQEIWMKYGIPFSSGATFLIDEKGEIMKINPSAGSIRKLLAER